MLGFFTTVTDLVDPKSMRMALKTSVKAKTLPLNLSAFQAGLKYEVELEDGFMVGRPS